MLKTLKPRKLDLKSGTINLTHGSGGKAMTDLIQQLFIPAFKNSIVDSQHDSAVIHYNFKNIVVTTDSHVVTPLFFPGGNIGSLAINGTVNDLAMSGATPLYITVSLILEEGFPLSSLSQIIDTMANAARQANVAIVAGDTKVVERGKGDGVFITTTGIGHKQKDILIHPMAIKKGDKIIISGTLGEHGVVVLSQRENLKLDTALISDTAALHELVNEMLTIGSALHCMRDPTRGGVASVLNELAHEAKVGMLIEEDKLPILENVKSACEIFGLDPLHVANEGKLVAFCDRHSADRLVEIMQRHPLGKSAKIIGEVIDDPHHFVQLKTSFGGSRIIDWIYGEQLPRIC